MRLSPNADKSHATASEMYSDYGWHTMCQICGEQYELQTIEYIDLQNLNADDLRDKVTAAVYSDDCDHGDIADELIDRARNIADDMESIESSLDEAVVAYNADDFKGTLDALDEASSLERDHGDDPASRQLRKQLIVDDPELTPHTPASDSRRDVIRAWLDDLSDVDPHEVHAREGDSIPECYSHMWDGSIGGDGGEGYETFGACMGVDAQIRWTPEGYTPHACHIQIRVWDGETDEHLPFAAADLDDLASRLDADLAALESIDG